MVTFFLQNGDFANGIESSISKKNNNLVMFFYIRKGVIFKLFSIIKTHTQYALQTVFNIDTAFVGLILHMNKHSEILILEMNTWDASMIIDVMLTNEVLQHVTPTSGHRMRVI